MEGKQFHVHDPATAEEIRHMGEMLKIIDEDANMSEPKTWESKKIQDFIEQHGRKRHYMFQLKKCQSDACGYCMINPPRMPEEMFTDLHFVSDPVPDPDGTFKDFSEVYGEETTDAARPSLLRNQHNISERDKKFKAILVATKVRGYVMCCECGKRRVIYSARKMSQAEENAVSRLQEELLYVCGNPLFPGGVHQDTVLVKEGISCSSTMECSYYAGKPMLFEEACFHCGDTEVADTAEIRQLKEDYGIVRPICAACIKEGKSIQTRNAVKVKKQKAR